jgi:ubiquitin carboxyl-terminal hydrolase L5
MEWTTIESDPGVFTELVNTIGVSDVSFEEVYALDVDELTRIEPIYGLIFLFKYTSEAPDEQPAIAQQDVSDVFFARQIIQNACATQAVLSVLLNAREDVELGETLNNFLEFTADFDADMKGVAVIELGRHS